MADSLNTFTQDLKLPWPGFHLELSREFGSNNPCHRELIRQRLATVLGVPEASLQDLTRRPDLENDSVSISHCPSLGGFVTASKDWAVGFDVEKKDRLKPSVVARVSSQAELDSGLQPWQLWVAKEAAWKALSPLAPPTIRNLSVSKWKSEKSQILSFEIAEGGIKPIAGEGFIVEFEAFGLGFFGLQHLNPPRTCR